MIRGVSQMAQGPPLTKGRYGAAKKRHHIWREDVLREKRQLSSITSAECALGYREPRSP